VGGTRAGLTDDPSLPGVFHRAVSVSAVAATAGDDAGTALLGSAAADAVDPSELVPSGAAILTVLDVEAGASMSRSAALIAFFMLIFCACVRFVTGGARWARRPPPVGDSLAASPAVVPGEVLLESFLGDAVITSAEVERVRLLLRLRLRRCRRCDRLLVIVRDGEPGQAPEPAPSPTETVVGTGSWAR
jgi:hypothetical protein